MNSSYYAKSYAVFLKYGNNTPFTHLPWVTPYKPHCSFIPVVTLVAFWFPSSSLYFPILSIGLLSIHGTDYLYISVQVIHVKHLSFNSCVLGTEALKVPLLWWTECHYIVIRLIITYKGKDNEYL